MFARWMTALAGLWLMIAPWVLGAAPQARTNDFWTGLLIVIVAAAARRLEGIRYLHLGLGGWLLLAPFVLAYSHPEMVVNDVVVGAVVMALSLLPTLRRVDRAPQRRERVVTP